MVQTTFLGVSLLLFEELKQRCDVKADARVAVWP